MTKQAPLKAFRISNHFSVPGGRRYKRSDYYQAKSRGEEELLTIAQFAHELESGTAPPAPPPPPAKTTPAATPQAPAFEETKSDEPDWSYMTVSAMRAWLDRAGVMLPGAGGSKPTHEELCKDAWVAGRRQNPLYGFPGGPVPSPGQAGPASQGLAEFAKAIEAAHAAGSVISKETRDAFEALTTKSVETVAEAAQEDGQEEASGSAPATNADDSTEPPESTSDGDSGSQEAQDTTEDVDAYVASLTDGELGSLDGNPETPVDVLAVVRKEIDRRAKVDQESVTIHEGEELVVTVGDDGGLSLATQPEGTDAE